MTINNNNNNHDSELILRPTTNGGGGGGGGSSNESKPAKELASFSPSPEDNNSLNGAARKRRQSYPYQHYQNKRKNGSRSGSGSSSITSTSYRMLNSCGAFIRTVFPILGWVSYYPVKKYFLYGDLWAGIYVALYLIPQCMAYSSMSGIPAIFAFYSSVIAALIYAVFGSCRRLSYGVFSLVSAIYLGMVVDRYSPVSTAAATTKGLQDYVGICAVFTFFVGVFSAGAGLLRLGSLVRFVPYEIMSGFRAGLYLLVFSMQLNSIFGLDLVAQADLGTGRSLLMLPNLLKDQLYPHLKPPANELKWNCVAVTLVVMAVMAIFRLVVAFWFRLVGQRGILVRNILRLVPVEFIVVAVGFLVHYHVKSVEKYKLPLVGNVGKENESIFDIVHLHLEWPQFKLYFDKLWFECVTATLLVLFYTHSLAVDFNVADTEIKANRSKVKRFINPRRAKYVRLGWAQYSPSRELLTTAGTNIIASFLRCLPVGPSATRSSRMVSVGGRSQIAGLVSALVLVGLWFGLKNYLPSTPQCIVAAVVAFDAALAFFGELIKVKHFWSVSCLDVLIWLLTLAAFICLNLEFALYASLALALLVFTYRSSVFSQLRFAAQRNVVTNTNTNLIVPESVLTNSYSKYDLAEGDVGSDHNFETSSNSQLFSFISPSRMRELEIYRLEQRYLTVANVDGFVRDVFRRLGAAMKTESATRLVFDCSSVGYIDWPSVRAVKATILRTIEIAESWKQQPRPLYFFAGDGGGGFEKKKKGATDKEDAENGGEEQMNIVVAFVFRVKVVQLVHNAGRLNVEFWPTLHRSLHHGLKGAIYTILGAAAGADSTTTTTNSSSTTSSESGVLEVSASSSSNSSGGGGNQKETPAPISIISSAPTLPPASPLLPPPQPPQPPLSPAVMTSFQVQQQQQHQQPYQQLQKNMVNIEHHQLQQQQQHRPLHMVFSRGLSESEMEETVVVPFDRSSPPRTKLGTAAKIPRPKLSKQSKQRKSKEDLYATPAISSSSSSSSAASSTSSSSFSQPKGVPKTGKTDKHNGKGKDKGKGSSTLRNVTPLSFRMNDEYEFTSPTSSFGSNMSSSSNGNSRRSDPPIHARMETFTPLHGVPPPPPPSLSRSQASNQLEAFYLSAGPSTSSSPAAVFQYPPPPSVTPPPSPPPPVEVPEPKRQPIVVEETKVQAKASPSSPAPPPPPPPPPQPMKFPSSPKSATLPRADSSVSFSVTAEVEGGGDPAAADTSAEPISFKKKLESIFSRPKSVTSVNSPPSAELPPSSSTMPSPKTQQQVITIPIPVDPNDSNGSNGSISVV